MPPMFQGKDGVEKQMEFVGTDHWSTQENSLKLTSRSMGVGTGVSEPRNTRARTNDTKTHCTRSRQVQLEICITIKLTQGPG